MIEAVVFDMDGLLVQSDPLWLRNRRALVEEYGAPWTESDELELAGVDTSVWVDAIHRRIGGRLAPERVREEVLRRMAGSYAGGEIIVLPGAHEALAGCSRVYRTGLASGSPRFLIDAALAATGWASHFENILSSEDVTRGKPAPDVYLEILRRMGVSPARSVVVEDSSGGIRAGKAAGARVVAVPNPHTLPPPEVLAMADARIDSLHALGPALDAWNREPMEDP
jgi:HAD superfamily hydrolase (TIGR01509 family)